MKTVIMAGGRGTRISEIFFVMENVDILTAIFEREALDVASGMGETCRTVYKERQESIGDDRKL